MATIKVGIPDKLRFEVVSNSQFKTIQLIGMLSW